jgi:hypothetical protein
LNPKRERAMSDQSSRKKVIEIESFRTHEEKAHEECMKEFEQDLLILRKTIDNLKKALYKDYSKLAKKYIEATKEIETLKTLLMERDHDAERGGKYMHQEKSVVVPRV